jgi:hypothetical protein
MSALLWDASAAARRRQADDLARPVAGVHQAADHAQLVDLLDRVDAFAEGIARGRGEAVAALPHAQRVLGQPGVALDRRDAERDRTVLRAIVHASWLPSSTARAEAGGNRRRRACPFECLGQIAEGTLGV